MDELLTDLLKQSKLYRRSLQRERDLHIEIKVLQNINKALEEMVQSRDAELEELREHLLQLEKENHPHTTAERK